MASASPTGEQAPAVSSTGRRSSSWSSSIAGLYALVLAHVLIRDIGSIAYDDAYFFKRFAWNALEHGVHAWNLGDGPVHGSTSALFGLITVALTAAAPTHFVLLTKVWNALCLLAGAVVLLRWCGRATSRPLPGQLLALFGLSTPMVLTTIHTGMETATALALLIVALTRMFPPVEGKEARGVSSDLAAAGWTVLIYACRPDAAVLPAVAYGVHALIRRELPWRYVTTTFVLLALLLLGLRTYYGTALPLSFYMKANLFDAYGEHVLALGRAVKQRYVLTLLAFATPLLWIAGHGRDAVPRSLLAGTAALWLYHLFSTNEIMGYQARFYVPGLVPLCLASARAWDAFALRRRFASTAALCVLWGVAIIVGYMTRAILVAQGGENHIPWPTYLGHSGLGALLLLRRASSRAWLDGTLASLLVLMSTLAWKPPARPHVRDDATILRRHVAQTTAFRGVYDVQRCLPKASTVYHSEMGVTGLVLMDMRVVDLVGLLSTHVLRGERFESLCQRDRPAAIFLPHRNYEALNREIREAPCFAEYRRVVAKSASPLYVRRDLLDPFLACAKDVHRWRR